MTERDFYPAWKKWVEKQHFKGTQLYEVKLVNMSKGKKPFSFNQVHDYQQEGLLEALGGKFVRIMDQPYTENGFQQRKLCDSLWVKASECFVVVIFWIPRKLKTAVLIPIKDFVKLQNTHPKKSIHLEELQFENIKL